MLLNIDRNAADSKAEYDVTNIYKQLVFDHILKVGADLSADAQADAGCLALNRLPSKYIRHAVDWMFFVTPAEIDRINRAVDMAVTNAIAKVLDNPPLDEVG